MAWTSHESTDCPPPEGLVVLAPTLGDYLTLGGPLWLLGALALAPDLSMIGYLAGARVGSLSYNVVHTYAIPLAPGTGHRYSEAFVQGR